MSTTATWQAQADWMREVHATEASWDDVGNLRSLKLADLSPEAPVSSNPAKRRSPAQQAEDARIERRRIGLLASGGPVRRVSEPG